MAEEENGLAGLLDTVAEPLPDHLPARGRAFRGETYEAHVEAARSHIANAQSSLWGLASVCASLAMKHGEATVPTFATDIGLTAARVWDLAHTFRAWENSKRFEFLSFSHHQIAARAPDPRRALEVAQEQGMSVSRLRAFVKSQKEGSKQSKGGKDVEPHELQTEPGQETGQHSTLQIECPHCHGTGWIDQEG